MDNIRYRRDPDNNIVIIAWTYFCGSLLLNFAFIIINLEWPSTCVNSLSPTPLINVDTTLVTINYC